LARCRCASSSLKIMILSIASLVATCVLWTRPALQTFLPESQISYYKAVREPDILRNLIVSEYVTLYQINKYFVNTPFFHYWQTVFAAGKMASRAVVCRPLDWVFGVHSLHTLIKFVWWQKVIGYLGFLPVPPSHVPASRVCTPAEVRVSVPRDTLSETINDGARLLSRTSVVWQCCFYDDLNQL